MTEGTDELTRSFLSNEKGKEIPEPFQPEKNDETSGPLDSKNNSNGGLWKQFFAAFSVCSLCISAGNFLGFTSTAIPWMEEDRENFPNLTPYNISWIGGLCPLGALTGSILAIFPIRIVGPKFTILFISFPFLISSWLLIAFSSNLDMIFAGRFFGGLGSGLVLCASPIYVIEIVDTDHRGKIGILPQFLLIFGIWLSTIIGTFVKWRTLALISSLITLPSLPLLIFAPQSPLYYIKRNKLHLARLSYHRLGRCHVANCGHPSNNNYYSCTFQQFAERHEMTSSQDNKGLSLPIPNLNRKRHGKKTSMASIKACAVALFLMSCQQLIGINGVTFYAVSIFKASSSVNSNLSYFSAIFLISVQLIAVIISTLLVDKCGRKTLLFISGIILTLSSLTLGVFYYFCSSSQSKDNNDSICAQLYWMPLVLLISYVFAFALGYGPICWVVVSEILPQKSRDLFNPVCIGYSWLCIFIVTSSFPVLMIEIQLSGIFFLFGSVGVLSLLFIGFCVPETKSKSLDEIQRWFERKEQINK